MRPCDVQFFGKGDYLLGEGFELPGFLLKSKHLFGDGDGRKMSIHSPDNLVVIVTYALKLCVKLVQQRDIPGHRRVGFHDAEFSAENAANDKAAAVAAHSGLLQHTAKAYVLFFVQAKGVLETPLIVIIIHIHSSCFKVARLGSDTAAPQGEHLCRTNASLSDKGTARYRLRDGKTRQQNDLRSLAGLKVCGQRPVLQ